MRITRDIVEIIWEKYQNVAARMRDVQRGAVKLRTTAITVKCLFGFNAAVTVYPVHSYLHTQLDQCSSKQCDHEVG
jgi:hypothetical protein